MLDASDEIGALWEGKIARERVYVEFWRTGIHDDWDRPDLSVGFNSTNKAGHALGDILGVPFIGDTRENYREWYRQIRRSVLLLLGFI